ncbi:probable glutamate receptor [Centruroides vittatus]|uniref:probable glutamate receptor n=1 Tax=Centruroides vittatus TaxID=120091 RepID=UPI00350EBD49
MEANGTYTGSLSQLVYQESDFSFLPYTVTYDRFHLVDFSSIIGIYKIIFTLLQRKDKSDWKTIIKPFSLEIWIGIAFSILFSGLVIPFLVKYEQRLLRKRNYCSVKRTMWYLFGTLTLKGGNIDMIKCSSSRLLLGIWLLCVVTLDYSYGGLLTSYLTAPVYEQVPKNFNQLVSVLKKNEFACGSDNHGYLPKYIQKSTSGVAKEIKNYIEFIDDYSKMEEITKRLQQGRFAYVTNEHWFKRRYQDHLKGKIVFSEDAILTINVAFATRKNFQFQEKLSKTINRLFEAGIIDHLNERKLKKLYYENDHVIHPLSFNELIGAMVLLAVGYVLSIACFLVEYTIGIGKNISLFSDK